MNISFNLKEKSKLDKIILQIEEESRKVSDKREECKLTDETKFQLKLFTLLCNNTQAAPPPIMASPYYYSHGTNNTACCDDMYDM